MGKGTCDFLHRKKCKKLKTNTKKAVIVKLLLVYLKAALRKLHNTLLASYGSVQRALLHILMICFGVQ